jgi:hypothetical protein
MDERKSLFPTFSPCFFCKTKVYVAGCSYMFQGQPVCDSCAAARKEVAYMCTPTQKYVGIDPNWREKALPGRRQNVPHR